MGERDTPPTAERVRSIGQVAGWDGEVIAMPKDLLPEHLKSPFNYEHDLAVDTSRIRSELGYEERVPRNEALLKTITWQRENQPPKVDPKRFDYAAEDDALEKLTNYLKRDRRC